jgi:ribosome maturation factor RimP
LPQAKAGKEMRYSPRKKDTGDPPDPRDPDGQLYDSLEPVIRGLKMSLIELNVFRSKARGRNPGSVQVKAVVYRKGITGLEDCSMAHRAILPRLELAFPAQEIYLEVSSPGIDRIIKDGSEFVHYIGQGIKVYRTESSSWMSGKLSAADEEKIVLKGDDGEISLLYGTIAKARLDGTYEK